MSNFLNKIPVSPITSFGNPSVPNNATFGTNFSILQTGGYMEVYSLSGLTYTIPPSTTGIIEFSGNSIPIQFTKGSGSVFSPDVLTLNSDNISSGRRKLGMLVYVYETKKIYQYSIDNYDTLWNNATGATGPGGVTVVISDYGTTVKNNSPEGQSFINAWTASTISGIDGYNDTTASWRVLQTGGSTFTGGTVSGATIFTSGLTANTISATTLYGDGSHLTGISTGETYTNSGSTPITIGGISSGSTFSSKTMTEMWNLLLYPYQSPSFSLFSRTGILSEYELGRPVTASTETFSWVTPYSGNVSTNTITIQQMTPSTVTLSSGGINDGSETINLISQQIISASTTGTLELYKIMGTNTNGIPFTSSISKTWKPRWYYGKNINPTLTNAQITGLTGTSLVTSVINTTVSIGTSATPEYMYFAIPTTIIPQPTVFRQNTASGSNIPCTLISSPSFNNSYNVSVTYNLYKSDNPVAGAFVVYFATS